MSDKKRVLVSCPSKNGIPHYWFAAAGRLIELNHPDYKFEVVVEHGNNAINLTRNIMAHHAMENNYWKHVQIDADMYWEPEKLIRLVSHDVPIVAAPYCKKRQGKVTWLIVATPRAEIQPDGLLECDFMGTGMMSVDVAAYRKMVAFYPERTFLEDNESKGDREMTELFPIGLVGPNTPEGRLARIKRAIEEGRRKLWPQDVIIADIQEILTVNHPDKARLLGEDYHFCALAKKAGLKMYCDTKALAGHIGDACFPLPEQMVNPPPILTHNLDLKDW